MQLKKWIYLFFTLCVINLDASDNQNNQEVQEAVSKEIASILPLFEWQKSAPTFDVMIQDTLPGQSLGRLSNVNVENRTATISIGLDEWHQLSHEAQQFVLAHEIAHFLQRDLAPFISDEYQKDITFLIPPRIKKLLEALAIGYSIKLVNTNISNVLFALPFIIFFLAFTELNSLVDKRAKEFDADKKAMLAIENLKGALDFFELAKSLQDSVWTASYFGYGIETWVSEQNILYPHPSIKSRLDRLQRLSKNQVK